MIYCINFRYFTAPASKFPKPPCETFLYQMRPLAVFLAIYIININSPNIFAMRKNPRKFHARSVCFATLRLGRGYLGVSRKFSLNLLDFRSNLKVAYQPLLV